MLCVGREKLIHTQSDCVLACLDLHLISKIETMKMSFDCEQNNGRKLMADRDNSEGVGCLDLIFLNNIIQ